MKKASNKELISELTNQNFRHIEKALLLLKTQNDLLIKKPNSSAWSAQEAVEHLNRYFDFYLPEIKNCIHNGIANSAKKEFKSGWLGNYFVKSMQAIDGKVKPIKTLKDKDPALYGSIRENNILIFINNLNEFNTLILAAEQLDLNKTKTSISLSKFIKLKLGDTLRFIVNHNERHLNQALGAAELL
jgi:hypothetical protein